MKRSLRTTATNQTLASRRNAAIMRTISIYRWVGTSLLKTTQNVNSCLKSKLWTDARLPRLLRGHKSPEKKRLAIGDFNCAEQCYHSIVFLLERV